MVDSANEAQKPDPEKLATDRTVPMNLSRNHPAYARMEAANNALWHANVILTRALEDAREYATITDVDEGLFPLLALLSRSRTLVSAAGQLLSADDPNEHIEQLCEEVWHG